MSDQAVGSQASISIWDETTYGVRPGTPALFKIKSATDGVSLKASVEKLVSKAITSARGVPGSRGGNIGVSGSIPFELPLLGIGKLIKHAVGASVDTAIKLATIGTGLTNLIVKYADTGTPAGAGTVTLSGATLTWAAFGETAGAAVNVSAGGDFTLQSSTASHALHVMVTGTVVGTTATATATVGAAAYLHVISRGALPVGFGAEVAYGDISVYDDYDGLRIDKLSVKVGNSGMVTGSIDVKGKSSSQGVAALGTPTSLAHVPFVHHEATVMDGGASIGVTSFEFDISNELDESHLVGSRYLSQLREGMGSANGKITTLFTDVGMINKVMTETATSARVFFGAVTGSIEFLFPNVKYYGDVGNGISTSKGIVASNDFQADSSVGATDIIVTLINSEATL